MRYTFLLSLFILFLQVHSYAGHTLTSSPAVFASFNKDSLTNPSMLLNEDAFKASNARKLLGRKLTVREKLGLAVFRHELKKEKKRQQEGRDAGQGAFTWGLISLLSFLIPGAGILALPFGIVAIVKGNHVLRTDPNNRKARTGVTMGIISIALLALLVIILAIILIGLY